MSTIVKTGGVTDRLVCVLSYTKWQTASIIACQVTFPPDAIARTLEQQMRNNRLGDAALEYVSKALSQMYRNGYLQRRQSKFGTWEYMLLPGCDEKFAGYILRIKHDAYHKGYVRKCDFPDKKRFQKIAEDLVLRGILVAEPDGNFTLNPNIKTEKNSNECIKRKTGCNRTRQASQA